MTKETFDRKAPLVTVKVTVKVNNAIKEYIFAVDTGATITLISEIAIKDMGYSSGNSIGTTHTVTASRAETVYEYSLNNIMALGLIRRNFKVISRELPIGLGIDGLLGLNFFKHKELTIDFKRAEIRIQ